MSNSDYYRNNNALFAKRNKTFKQVNAERRQAARDGGQIITRSPEMMKELKKVTRKKALETGLTYYWTGKPCKHGHIDLRFTVGASCCSCMSIKSKERNTKVKQNKMLLIDRIKENQNTNYNLGDDV